MGQFTFTKNELTPHRTIEKQRISSDNFRVYLYLEKFNADTNGTITYGDTPLLTLTNTSLTKFNLAANDEIKKKKPCTRKEMVMLIFHKGFDIDLQFAKVTDDISSMMFLQYINYHGDTKSLGRDKRTDGKTLAGTGVSVFGSNSPKEINYEVPTYKLAIGIKHFDKIEELVELYGCRFYNFTQGAEEGSSDIIETIKCFSPYCTYASEGSKNVFFNAEKAGLQGILQGKSAKKYIINRPNTTR